MANFSTHGFGMLAATLLLATAPAAYAQMNYQGADPGTPAARADEQSKGGETDIPVYKVDPAWPKPLPHNWIMGQVGALTVDSHDNIWVYQRPRSLTVDERGAAETPPHSECCIPAPSVLEFDQKGDVIRAWGGPGFVPEWPQNEHGILVDKEGFVWLGGSGTGDRQVLKFTLDGHQVLEIGHSTFALNKNAPPPPANARPDAINDPATENLGRASAADPRNNQDTTILGHPANLDIDEDAHELYIADGYLNNRIVVYDTDTGAFKRGWGAYGKPLREISNETQLPYRYVPGAPPDQEFRNPVHAVRLSQDGLVYVCDRSNDRIQVFTRQGKFQKEFILRPLTLGNGSCMQMVLSHDPQQKYLLVADAENGLVSILRRSDGVIVSTIGHKGRDPGEFNWVHTISMDSQGNLYTGEVNTGKRVQKFSLQK